MRWLWIASQKIYPWPHRHRHWNLCSCLLPLIHEGLELAARTIPSFVQAQELVSTSTFAPLFPLAVFQL